MGWSALLEKLYNFIKEVLALTRETEQNRAEIKELQQQLKESNDMVQRLAYEIHRISEREKHEREKIDLRMENFMLQVEKRLLEARLIDESSSNEHEPKKLPE